MLDVVIDDGGHRPAQQIPTLEELLPHLRQGGVYLCEDVNGVFNHFTQYVCGLSHNLNAPSVETVHRPGKEFIGRATPFQQSVSAIHLYANVVVIERPEVPFRELVCQRRGTQWQPFPLSGL